MKKAILIVLILVGILESRAQINVFKVGTPGINSNSEGLFYSLPQTVIQVDIVVNKIQKIKGPYSEFADQMIGLTQVTSSNTTEYELKDIRLNTFSEPDPSEFYYIQIPEKQKDRKSIELFLSKDGIIAGVGITNGQENEKKQKTLDLSSSTIRIPEFTNPSVFERMDTVIKRISLDSTIIEQKFFRKTSAAKSPEQKAREAAEFILKLDESMYNLINGYQEVNYEKGTMEFMYNQMNTMKKDYLELFKGITSTSNETYTFYFTPESDVPSEVLCKFSSSKGIVSKSSVSGEPVTITASSQDKAYALKSEVDKLKRGTHESHGLYYRIPERADIQVKFGDHTKLETQFLINQLGLVTFLPATSLRNIGIDNNTGTVRRVVLE